ncbi:MAG: Na+/H+ antiporter NhaA [Actinomycetota bacterium]
MPGHPAHVTWIGSERLVPRAFIRPFLRYANTEASSGSVLIGAAVIALIWANLAPANYLAAFTTPFRLEVGTFSLSSDLHSFINDGLMTLFFFVVGLEVKRELVVGELRDRRAAALPVMAAVGGMAGPGLIYLAIVGWSGEAGRGWGIPMATDIAFAVGILSLVGRRAPVGAKLFLLTLAIADDIGAILIIALFYTSSLSPGWLGMAVFGLLAAWIAGRIGVRSLTFYIPLGVAVWLAMYQSGVHPTLTGVFLGLLTPALPYYPLSDFHDKGRPLVASLLTEDDDVIEREQADHTLLTVSDIARESVSPLARIEHRLGLWSSFAVVPLFALSNAGVNFGEVPILDGLASPVGLGVALGLVAGKSIGIGLATWGAVRLRLGRLPVGMNSRHLLGVATVAGIGFTVSLFVTDLAFTNPNLANQAKVGIFAASFFAAVAGWLILRSDNKP